MKINNVEVVHWNPKRKIFSGLIGKLIPIKKKLNNFGDLIGPYLVKAILNENNIEFKKSLKFKKRLLTVGSIMHFAKDNDVIWGTGINGKISKDSHHFNSLDVRAVRGPLTRDILMRKGIEVPEIYGDPALLLPLFNPKLLQKAKTKRHKVLFVPNLNDYSNVNNHKWAISPLSNLNNVLTKIAQSKFVVGSSLHAIIIAEALGIPARFVKSKHEHKFKYEDYYYGTGRDNLLIADTPEEAYEMGGQIPLSKFSNEKLLNVFPYDLWKN